MVKQLGQPSLIVDVDRGKIARYGLNVADVNGNTGWDYISPDLTDGVAAWGTHTATFVVPAGQTCTRFAFRAVSTGSGDPDESGPRSPSADGW